MKSGPEYTPKDLEKIASNFGLPPINGQDTPEIKKARKRVEEDTRSAEMSGVVLTPTFFINGRRYESPWDENSLAEAMLGTLGHRLHAATLNFVRWGPSAGFLLLFMSVLAVFLANSPLGSSFERIWEASFGVQLNAVIFAISVLDWVNHGLLSIFFLVVGLEIKREFTVGHLATFRSGALPVAGAFGGIAVPILIYLMIAPSGPLSAGWGVPIATDPAMRALDAIYARTEFPADKMLRLMAIANPPGWRVVERPHGH